MATTKSSALGLLEHQPHRFDVIAGEAPVAFGVEVAEIQFFLESFLDAGGGAGDFAGDKCFAAAGAFVIEEDAVAGEHAVALAVIDSLPVAIDLGAGIGAAGIEGGCFGLRGLDDFAVHLAAGGLIKADGQSGVANGFEKIHGTHGIDGDGINGLIEADANVRLRAEVINFVRLNAREDFSQADAVDEIAVVEKKMGVGIVAVAIEVTDAVGVEGTAAADDAVNIVSFVEEKFGEIRAVLSGDTGDHGRLARFGWHEYAPLDRRKLPGCERGCND